MKDVRNEGLHEGKGEVSLQESEKWIQMFGFRFISESPSFREEEEDEFSASFAKTLESGSESKGEREGCEHALNPRGTLQVMCAGYTCRQHVC